MKKLLILTAALIVSLSINAQSFGFKIGVNLSGVNSSTQLEDFQTAALENGLVGGLVFEFMPLKNIGFRTEALFSQKGYSVNSAFENVGTDVVSDFSLNIGYIEVPLLLKLKLGPVYAVAGPYFSYAMTGEELVSITIDGQQLAEELYVDYNAVPSNDIFKSGEFNEDNIKFKRTDFGLNVGLGAKFLKSFAEVRYGVGLVNIQDYENMPADQFTKNYTISLSVGLLFGK